MYIKSHVLRKQIKGIVTVVIAATVLASFSACSSNTDFNAVEFINETTEAVTKPISETKVVELVNNSDSAISIADPINPTFSHEGGLYEAYITLELNLPDGAGVYAIRYTLNGDEPDSKAKKYEEPITLLAVKESVVVRAACFNRKGELLGNIITNTYIKNTNGRFSNMIISISSDDDYLNGSDGIILNPTNSGKEWERPSHIEVINEAGERVINQDAGLRIFGGSSRVLSQKSFRIVARKNQYLTDIRYVGVEKFNYAFFDNAYTLTGEPMVSFDRLILRNGGNDSLQSTAADPKEMNLLRDGIVNNFAVETSDAVTTQASKMVVVFLNGQYYGLLDLKEDINDDYIADYYGIEDKKSLTVIKSELDTSRHCSNHSSGGQCRFCNVWFFYEVDNGEESELDALTALLQKAINATDANYDVIYKEIDAQLDIENFMQYMALNLYVCNTDWPHNNIRVWRYNGETVDGSPYTDGKWRFTTRDEDFAFGRYECRVLPEIYTMADTDTFSRMLSNYWNGSYKYSQSTGNYPDSLLLQGLGDFLLKNDSFRTDFISYCKLLVSDANIALLRAMINEYADSIENEIAYHIERWNGTIDGGYTVSVWESSVSDMLKWLDERPTLFLEYLDSAMSHYE